ncbi:MAG TPA: hypothetical protein VFQ61_38880 [Polyangiaceae bacterium]|nr:hypothetical protein [Polyangiaceae bacterium]
MRPMLFARTGLALSHPLDRLISALRKPSLAGCILVAMTGACASHAPDAGAIAEEAERKPTVGLEQQVALVSRTSALTATDRLAACATDPRVIAGLVSQRVCAGADIFFRETFDGNGRTCGSCHPVANNFTLDKPFTDALLAANPADPLFVFQNNPALATLESSDDFLQKTGVRENLDGFSDLNNRFTVRAVPHIFSLAITTRPDPADDRVLLPGEVRPTEATGWSGDGSPNDGSLRQFLTGAIKQHFPKDLSRTAGVSFRQPTELELDLTLEYQRSVGRTNELDFTQLNLADSKANEGRLAYLDPLRARCNVCHSNGGANFIDTGLNRNFDTFARTVPDLLSFAGVTTDGGFGGQSLSTPNIDTLNVGTLGLTGFGDGTFNTPPVIEAVDTMPCFHNNGFGPDIEGCIAFYASIFLPSPAAQKLDARFGAPVNITGDDIVNIGRFLRVLNAAFNLDLAKQRLQAAQTLANRFHDAPLARSIQLQLLRLADKEISDALVIDLQNPPQLAPINPPLHPIAQERLVSARDEISAALSAGTWSARTNRIGNALSRVLNARDQFGSNINFRMGSGNIMF